MEKTPASSCATDLHADMVKRLLDEAFKELVLTANITSAAGWQDHRPEADKRHEQLKSASTRTSAYAEYRDYRVDLADHWHRRTPKSCIWVFMRRR